MWDSSKVNSSRSPPAQQQASCPTPILTQSSLAKKRRVTVSDPHMSTRHAQKKNILAGRQDINGDLARLALALLRHRDDLDWRRNAACKGSDTERFYDEDSARGAYLRRNQLDAKRTCARCPVIESCLSWALLVNETHGIWGGLTPSERSELAARHS